MNIVEQVEKICGELTTNGNYKAFEDALKKYYELVEEGIITPRENSLLNNYTPVISEEKLKYSNLKI